MVQGFGFSMKIRGFTGSFCKYNHHLCQPLFELVSVTGM
jgi:hypothetical protein